MLDLSSRKVYGALAEQCVGGDAKADKVETAVAGHLAGLDSNGNLTDSGVSPTEDVTVEGNPVTFVSPFEQDAKSVVVSVKPIQSGSGTPSPDNIRPISGIDELEIGVSGKNKLPLTVNGIKTLNTTGTWSGNVYTINNGTIEIMTDNADNVTGIKANGTFNANTYFFLLRDHSIDSASLLGHEFILNGCPANGSASTYSLSAYLENITPSDYVDYGSGVTIEYPALYVNNNIAINLLANYTATDLIFAPMLRDSSVSDSSFEPYKGEPTTTTIPLPSTLYDADVDVTEGSATSDVTKINCKNLNFSISTSGGGLHWVDLSSKTDIEPISDKMEYLNAGDGWNSTIPCISKNSDNEVRIYGSSEFFADGGSYENAEVLYQLITPTTLSLTPTDVELLEGTNVVTTNAEKVAVTYGRSLWQDIDELKTDTEGKLDKSDVADVEGDTASRPYSVNEFMLRADGLYKVTQPIASGASITASNTTKTTIGAVLTALLNA